MNSKGFVIVAVKNTRGTDYVKHAAALSASIKRHCRYNSVCLITDSKVTKSWQPLFDHVITVSNQAAAWTQNVLPRIYQLSPYHETIHIEADCLVQSSLDHWWSGCQKYDILFTARVKDLRGNWSYSDYRSHFDRSDLPKIYTGVYYFRKSTKAKKLHDTMQWVVDNWVNIKDTVFDPNLDTVMGNDEVAAVALALNNDLPESYMNSQMPYPTFCHMKPRINQWAEIDLTKALGVYLDKDWNLTVGTYLQQGVWHYQNKDFLTRDLLDRYVASVL